MIAHELHAIRQAHKKIIEGQNYGFYIKLEKVREGFQKKIEKVRKELHQVDLYSIILEYEINTQKDQKQMLELRLTQDTLVTKNTPIIPSSIKLPKRVELINLSCKSYA